MQLHELKAKKLKKSNRIGRGGKRGTYSGRGIKGQKARAGRRIKPQARELILRLPKLRGFKNKSFRIKTKVLNLGELEKKLNLKENSLIDRKILLDKKIIRKSDKKIKILGNGELKIPVKLRGLEVSNSARKKIESAGGKIE